MTLLGFRHSNSFSLSASVCVSASDVLGLDGASGLTYRLDPETRPTDGDVVSLNFKTLRNSGKLLQEEGGGGASLNLELHRGRLELLLRTGECVCV